jgi:microcystin degradation protein MlrC
VRALIAGIVHESSTFMVPVSGPTLLADFDVHVGEQMVAQFGGTNTVVGGYLDSCRRHGVTAVSAVHARAEPGAAVDPSTHEALLHELLGHAAAAGPVEVVLLDLHGAGTVVGGESLDLAVARGLRSLLGADTVFAATLDLHANLPDELVPLFDVLVGYHEYPHTDMAHRAKLAADIAIGSAGGSGGSRPVSRILRLPMLVPPSSTLSGAAAEAMALARRMETHAAVRACTVFHGFPYADTPHASVSVVTVTDREPAVADDVNLEVGRWLWEHRAGFLPGTLTPEQAVREALASTAPAVIGDGTDNPGSGAAGDSTYLLQALLDSDARACFATLHDPAAVEAAVSAGPGATVGLTLGGRHGWASGPPLRVEATVRALTDGRVVQQVMRRGKTLDFGVSARVRVGAVDIVLASLRRQVFDPEILLLHGIQPDRNDIVVVKSVSHFRAGFAAVAGRLLVADAPGPLTRDIATLHKAGPTAGLWPMNPNGRFHENGTDGKGGGIDGPNRRGSRPAQYGPVD